MVRIVRGEKSIKTITFPSTVREVSNAAFNSTLLRSIVLNEGLEKLGGVQGNNYPGVFS